MFISRMLELCKARLRYQLPCAETVLQEVQLLCAEGKAVARRFCMRLLKNGIKIIISGDLWSENGMGLFGIYAHGIVDDNDEGCEDMPPAINSDDRIAWQMENKLIGLVACESERHTKENINKWTKQALEGIGLDPEALVDPFSCNRPA